jgi:hypothetical protein
MNSLMWNNLQTSSHRTNIPIATSQGMSLISSRREINVLVQAESFRARRQEAAKTGEEQDYLRKKCAGLEGACHELPDRSNQIILALL